MKVYNFESKPSKQSFFVKFKKWSFWRKQLSHLPWPFIGTWVFRLAAAGVLVLAFLFIYYSRQLPDPNRLLGRNVPESTKIYARDESLLYEVHGEYKRTLVNLDQISPYLVKATIAAEDKNFYNHVGISPRAIFRSLIIDIIYREKRQGGSTITQQFVKNAMLSRDKSFLRKLKEIILSIELEARFSKDEILKMYLNEIPYGRNAYGIQSAAITYFNKNANELSIAESAYLAALPQAPSYYNPSGPNFEALQTRQRYILGEMLKDGSITQEQYDSAVNETVVFEKIKSAIKAPHFVQYVQEYLAQKYGEATLQEGGLKVYTTLDPKLQEIADRAVTEGATKNESANGYNAALVAIDPKNGQILAMVGSKDYFGDPQPENCVPGKTCLFEPNVNVATTLQQPGSSFKPYAYLTAFGKDFGYSPASMLVDVVTNFGDYTPKNFNLAEHGPVSMRQALAGSLNIPAVKTIALVGEGNVIDTAKKLGVKGEFKDCGLAVVLGGCDVKLIDHTLAYATLANGGKRNPVSSILKVVSKEGEVLEEFKEDSEQVIDPQAVYLLTSILSDNSARAYVFGANSALTLGDRPVAAKTGTTQDFRDGWTMGFTPSLAAGVWTGNNNNAPMKKDAVLMAGPIWNRFMREALAGTPVESFNRPGGITEVTVDAVTGKLPTQYTPETKTEVFADYAIPSEYDDMHVPVKIDTATGQPATSTTPVDRVRVELYKELRSERPDYPAWEDPVRQWAMNNGYQQPTGSEPVQSSDLINFANLKNNATISKLPFKVSLNTSSNQVKKIDLLLDGKVIASLEEAPYTTIMTGNYSSGSHSLTAVLYEKDGNIAKTTITIKLSPADLEISEPASGSSGSLPIYLEATSNENYDKVNFLIDGPEGITNLGSASKSKTGDVYRYKLTWSGSESPGKYQIFAKSSSGATSKKVAFEIKE